MTITSINWRKKSFQTIFVPQLLDVPEIKSHFSGRAGFEKHFEEMLGNQTGKIFREIERFPGQFSVSFIYEALKRARPADHLQNC